MTDNQPEKKQDKPAGFYLKPDSVQTEVSFKTEDDWTIYGTYTVPNSYKPGDKLPAALLLHASMHSQTVWVGYPGWAKIQESIATLRIDWRGRGKSREPIPYIYSSPTQRERVALDVTAALNFLASQKEVDASRLGVAAEEFSASPAIIGAVEDPRVRVMVLLSGLLNQRAMELVKTSAKPMLFVVSKEDKRSFNDMTEAYNLNSNVESEIWVQDGLGIGATMGSVWRNKYTDQPIERAIDYTSGEWLVNRLWKVASTTEAKEVTLKTRDGWTLYANLRLPAQTNGGSVPGVILLPTALVDRDSYHSLEQMLVSQGIAVLNIDWRGIGKSIGKGNYVDMTLSELLEAPQDVHLAAEYLVSQAGVDPERIGVLGTALAAKLALHAVKQNDKLKALVMLTPVTWPWERENDSRTITSLNRPVLLVTGDGFGELTKEFADLVAKDERNKVITYPGGIFGYLLLRNDKDLEPTITQWLREQLDVGGKKAAQVSQG
jgi:cephalosporin-C deacetylase-like acetyl esterase